MFKDRIEHQSIRRPLTQHARALRDMYSVNDVSLKPENYTEETATRLWNSEAKLDRYKHLANLIDYVQQSIVEQSPHTQPFGVISIGHGPVLTKELPYHPYDEHYIVTCPTEDTLSTDLASAFNTTMLHGILNTFDLAQQQGLVNHAQTSYDRLDDWFAFRNAFDMGEVTSDLLFSLFGGSGTQRKILQYGYGHIEPVYRRQHISSDFRRETQLTIARNSFPLVWKMRNHHADTLTKLMGEKTSNGLPIIEDPTSFRLIQTVTGLQLDYAEQVGEELSVSDREKSQFSPIFGCPAGVNFGDPSVIKSTWGWYLNTLETMYQIYQQKDSIIPCENCE